MINEIIELFDERDELEDRLDLINNKLTIMFAKLQYKESSFSECKKYNRNWISDF